MAPLWHALIFVFSGALIWFLAGMLIGATERIAHRLKRSNFSVAFLLLGFITSISEMSVALNASLKGVPQASAGNLVGASFVIFLLIIPALAAFGGSVALTHSFRRKELLFALTVIAVPSLMSLDGRFSTVEGWLMILFYVLLAYIVETKQEMHDAGKLVREEITPAPASGRNGPDLGKIMLGGTVIFVAARLLVNETVYFSDFFAIPVSFIGLLVLSIGTNVPELVIAIRAIAKRYKQVAFGDYVGSAAANTLILGVLTVAGGPFEVAREGFRLAFGFLIAGLALFFIFARSKNRLSRAEAFALGAVYLGFLLSEVAAVAR